MEKKENKEPRRRFSEDLATELDRRTRTICNVLVAPDPHESVLKTLDIFLAEFATLAAKSVEEKTWKRRAVEALRGWIERQAARKPMLAKSVAELTKSYERAWELSETK